MINELTAINYGCLRDVRVPLSRLHALIGPNDSGKSTILRAIRTLAQLASSQFRRDEGLWSPFDPGFAETAHRQMTLEASVEGGYYAVRQESDGSDDDRPAYYDASFDSGGERQWKSRDPLDVSAYPPKSETRGAIGHAQYLALSEEGLRAPSGFMPKSRAFLSSRGEGLPGVYFALRNDREEAFERILTRTRELFPTVKTVRAQPRSTTELEIEIELTDGTRVRAAQISAGLLYFLAFAALPEFLGQAATVLLEEPENGLHPARIREVIAVLREATVSDGNPQIIMATHSPLVINELRPEEVSVVTRPSVETGTIVTPIGATPNFEKRSSVYALGELWLSYADGRTEKPLFDPTAR